MADDVRNIATLVLSVVLFGVSCGKEVGRVRVDLGKTATQSMALPEKARVLFPVHADSFSYKGRNYVMLKVELLRQDKVVGSLDCRAFHMDRDAGGAGCGGTAQLNTDCETEVPPGGADALRVSTHLETPEHAAEFENLAVGVRIKE
jgi:hypothetical protein